MNSRSRMGLALSGKIGLILLCIGFFSLFVSVLYTNQVLAFIGLGVTFWGILFVLVMPEPILQSHTLAGTAAATYSTIDRIIKNLERVDKAYYISSVSAKVELPDYLKELREATVFVSEEKNSTIPSIEDIAQGRFIVKNPNGVLVTAPGSGLLAEIEGKSGIEFSKTSLIELFSFLSHSIVEDLHLAREMELENENNCTTLRLVDTAYKSLFNNNSDSVSLNLLGCPIASAVACALAKATGKAIIIRDLKTTRENSSIEVSYQTIEDQIK